MERIEHKQNFAKRFLSVMLALAMILTCTPDFALTKTYAAEATYSQTVYVQKSAEKALTLIDNTNIKGTVTMDASDASAEAGKDTTEKPQLKKQGTNDVLDAGEYILIGDGDGAPIAWDNGGSRTWKICIR